ncbi:hypothetical protein CYLTODRAFT_423645 [Cylindrobasidium torrendii FP15055 ss-10]|uniref:Uncharacterized protein n=1 Tax=Cylindrobasidium torrendii FP15055 ss-10 TaxID=1314674 RepID=A0A0D7B7L9_9AGAR|nr:hypothetical protein CYLTODRAFT_423645 [Cylindrobasidium torrendii FP15055 ss-10]
MHWLVPLLVAHAASASQAIFSSAPPSQDATDYNSNDRWDFDLEPNVNATGHLIFDNVASFLQHWPNTRYRNGHSLVMGTVPVGTLLYHGRGDSRFPTEPQWTATDPEHAEAFCRGSKEEGCWLLTLVNNRPLNVLYFDGSAAAKMPDGPMDAQDIVAWQEIKPNKYFAESERLEDLCAWGAPLGLDGFVRMEMDFEIMLCDFAAPGIETAYFSNLHSRNRGHPGRPRPPPGKGPGGPPPPPPPGGNFPAHPLQPLPGGDIPSYYQPPYDDFHPQGARKGPGGGNPTFDETIHSGSWHDFYPGEQRIQLDISRMLSFYDVDLAPSLVAGRFKQERWFHRLWNISSEDMSAVMSRLENLVAVPNGIAVSSGVSWEVLVHNIVERYADRLEFIQHVLNQTDVPIEKTAKRVQRQLQAAVKPYSLLSAVPTRADGSVDWARPVYELCGTSHTNFIRHAAGLRGGVDGWLSESEQLVLGAIEQTNGEICRVVVRMWAQGVYAGLDDTIDAPGGAEDVDLQTLVKGWRNSVEELMSWLDWSLWVKCRPRCGYEEYCYLPTWPFFGSRDPEEIAKPQPSCIPKFREDE